MAANEVVPGSITRHVIDNVKRIRTGHNWSQATLAARLTEVGRPIRATGLHRLETGKRRIDVDDLVGLAAALEVSPITLLMPFTAKGTVDVTAKIQAEALAAWDWMRGIRPLQLPKEREEAVIQAVAFQGRSIPIGARALDPQLTAYYSQFEARPADGAPLDWDAHEERDG